MKGAKIFFSLLIFSIAVAFTGCSEPVGSLIYSLDYIKAVPSKLLYGKNERFKPAEQVQVVGVYGGVEDIIDINDVEIKIFENPGFSNVVLSVDDKQEGLVLQTEGPKLVVITYRDKEARYNIAVGGPKGTGDPGWGDGGTGIVINWPKP